jgi:hypothetical protein
MTVIVSPNALNELMDQQDELASSFTSVHFMGGKTYWTCVETLAQAKLAELDGQIAYTENQRFETHDC